MTGVFSHGRLRLYLLRLLDDGPKHGYELIRLLEERFLGLYAPSAGTIYPRLQRLEAEGRVTHQAAGGRKIYQITEAGRAELRQRADELAELESDIHASVEDLSQLADEIRAEVRGSVRDLKEEMRAAARQTRRGRQPSRPGVPRPGRPWSTARAGAGTAAGAGAQRGGWATQPAPGPGTPPTGWAATDDPGGTEARLEFEQRLAAFVAEARRLIWHPRFTETQLRTAIRLLDGALDGLRRLLR